MGARSSNLGAQFGGGGYVFLRTGLEWNFEDNLVPEDATSLDGYGFSISLYGDLVVLGSQYKPPIIFGRVGSSWDFENRLVRSGDAVGQSVSLWQDLLAIGGSGTVDVFRRNGSNWQLDATVTPDVPGGDGFGSEVALWGSWIAVSSTASDGWVYAFRQVAEGWREEHVLTGLGSDLSLAIHERWMVVGSPFAEDGTGVARVYCLPPDP